MDFLELVKNRRTVHTYTNKAVPNEIIEKCIEAANYAPCHKLTFPWRFNIINKDTRLELLEIFLKFKLAKDENNSNIKKIKERFLKPSHLIIVSQKLGEDKERIKEDYAACCCSIENMMLYLASKGVGSKWSTGKTTTSIEVYRLLNIKQENEIIIGFIWIGYGDIPKDLNRPEISKVTRIY